MAVPWPTKVVNAALTGILARRGAFGAGSRQKRAFSGGAMSGGSARAVPGPLSAIRSPPGRARRRRAGRGGWRAADGPAQGFVALGRLRRSAAGARALREGPVADRASRSAGDAPLVQGRPLRPALRRADPRHRSAVAGQPLPVVKGAGKGRPTSARTGRLRRRNAPWRGCAPRSPT